MGALRRSPLLPPVGITAAFAAALCLMMTSHVAVASTSYPKGTIGSIMADASSHNGEGRLNAAAPLLAAGATRRSGEGGAAEDDDGAFVDDLDEAVSFYREYEAAIIHYLDSCASLLDHGFECCGYDELVALFAQRIDPRCLQPWGTRFGCAPGFYSPVLRRNEPKSIARGGSLGRDGKLGALDGGETSGSAGVGGGGGGFNTTRVLSKHKVCPPGFFCPAQFLCVVPCSEGAYCPTGSLEEYTRPADATVAAGCRANETFCCAPYLDPPFLGTCGGASKDEPCPGGRYCPDTTTSEICPRGSFCRPGSLEPQVCPPLTKCPEGTKSPASNFIAVVVIAAVVIVASLAWVVMRYWDTIAESAMVIGGPFGKCFYRIMGFASRDADKVGADGPLLDDDDRREDDAQLAQVLPVSAPRSSDQSGDQSGNQSGDQSGDQSGAAGKGGNDAVVELVGGAPAGVSIVEKSFKLELGFERLGLTLRGPTKKVVLRGVSGRLLPHRVTAVMGPSGAGKTTFLSTLSGKASYGVTSGTILVNGEDTPLSRFRPLMGFVPQEDTMHRVMTAREILLAQAELRLPRSVTAEERRARVEDTIRILDLERVSDIPIGDEETRGISGGQRKRVNIGMELVADPTLLFLDEPTSGLDSTSSFQVLRALRHVAEAGGLTIAAVLHQPRFEIFRLFHDVLLLGPGGRTVYLGPSELAQGYFESIGFELPPLMNPADFFMDAIAGMYRPRGKPHFTTEDLFDAWAEGGEAYLAAARAASTHAGGSGSGSGGGADTEGGAAPPVGLHGYTPRVKPTLAAQTWTCFVRSILLQTRAVREIIFDLVLVLLAGSMLGLIYRNVSMSQLMGLNAMASLALGLLAMISSLRFFGNDKAVYWREASSGVSKVAIFLGTSLSHIPLLVLMPSLFLSMLYTYTAPRAPLSDHFLVTVSTFWATTGIGYAISVACSQRTSQMACVVVALISSMLAGTNPTIPTLDKITFFGPLAYSFSYCRWYTEAMFETEVERFPFVWTPQVMGYARHFGYSLDNFSMCIFVLWAFGFASRALSLLLLVGLNRGKMK